MTDTPTIDELRTKIAEFVHERDWEQFHSPKNLVMALSVEVAELVEHFQWLTEQQSQPESLSEQELKEIANEIGDITNYLLLLGMRIGIDPLAACGQKLESNKAKHPPS